MNEITDIANAHNSILNLTQFYGTALNKLNQQVVSLQEQVSALTAENAKLSEKITHLVARGARLEPVTGLDYSQTTDTK